MDLGLLFSGLYVIPLVLNLIVFLGMVTLGYLTYIMLYNLNHYLKFKRFPTNEIEYKYINILEENNLLKQKISDLEAEQNQLFNQLLEQLKEK